MKRVINASCYRGNLREMIKKYENKMEKDTQQCLILDVMMSNTSWDICHNISVSFDLHVHPESLLYWSQLLSSLCAASMTDWIYISSSRSQVQAHICVAAKMCNETKPLFDFFFFFLRFCSSMRQRLTQICCELFKWNTGQHTHTHFKDVRFDFVPYYTELIRGSHLSVTVSSPQRYLSIV